MNILMNVEHILIRATYSSTQTSTSISDISVEQAAPSGSTKPATMVEVCDSCPAGYVGMLSIHNYIFYSRLSYSDGCSIMK